MGLKDEQLLMLDNLIDTIETEEPEKSFPVDGCVSYLHQTADDFEGVERSLLHGIS